MAIATYEKAIALTGDKDCKELLNEARECKEDYVQQKPLQHVEAKELVFKDAQMAPQATIGRKATIGKAIQRQILFDEWSFHIKPKFLPDLKVMGEAWREELEQHPKVRLIIEGHTDKRGSYDRNMQLSKDRAEAIKTFLVQNYGINPSQLATEGFGPNRPYSPEENEAGWVLNRRVEFKKLD
jgi:OOP family OmpA-OmpF porin